MDSGSCNEGLSEGKTKMKGFVALLQGVRRCTCWVDEELLQIVAHGFSNSKENLMLDLPFVSESSPK